MNLKEFGQKLKRLRNAAGISQEKLAEFVGVSAGNVISKWERGISRPSREHLITLVRYFADSGIATSPVDARQWAVLAGHDLTADELMAMFPGFAPRDAPQAVETPWQHPPLPGSFIERTDLAGTLEDFLIRAGTQKTLVLTGSGGTGKTTLAAWAANDLKEQFTDGVIWLDFRQTPNIADLQQNIAGSINALLTQTTLAGRMAELRSLLAGKHCLLVLDDVWADEPHLRYLKVNNDTCPMLITTRDKVVARIFDSGAVLHVPGMTAEQGCQMLDFWVSEDDAPDEIDQLVRRLDGLPLALSLVGALLELGATSRELLDALSHTPVDFSAFDLMTRTSRATSLQYCFDLTYTRLPSDELRRYFAKSGVFAGTFSPEAASSVWNITLSQAKHVLYQLARFNLLYRDTRGFRLHALLHDYACHRLRQDWEQREATTRYRHALHYILHSLNHPAVIQEISGSPPDLDAEWQNIVAGVQWAAKNNSRLASIALVLAHTERQALLDAVSDDLVVSLENYLSETTDDRERAILLEICGDMWLLKNDYPTAITRFEQAAEIWRAHGNTIHAGLNKVRAAGGYLLQKQWKSAIQVVHDAQLFLASSLPVAGADLALAQRLFYWLNIVFSVLVRQSNVTESEVLELVQLGQTTGQPELAARGWHIYRLWCTAHPHRLADERIRRQARKCAARAACLWRSCGAVEQAQAEVLWTQEHTRGRRSRWLAEAFARRRSNMTPILGEGQISAFTNTTVRNWLSGTEAQRVAWLVSNMPGPGSSDWGKLDRVLGVGIRGKHVRRLVAGTPCPKDSFLTEPIWRVLTGQRTFPLCGADGIVQVENYRAWMQAELT